MFFRWMRERQKRRYRQIAEAVRNELTGGNGWERFLPPVVVRDTVYMVTESGSVYAMRQDHVSGMELITTIRRG